MSDVAKSGEVLLLGPPMQLPWAMPTGSPWYRVPQIHNHGPDQYCYFCSCQDCRLFFGRGSPIRCVDSHTLELSRPRYSYMGLVNSMRAASAKREEDRQDKLRAEREGTTTAPVAPKKDKASKDQHKKKNLRQNMKRRRQ